MSYGPDADFPGFADLDELPPGSKPTVFLFQPNGFENVTAERLLEWEQTLVEQLGLPQLAFNDDDDVLRGATWSNSGGAGEICADDSDVHFADNESTEGGGNGSDTRRPAIFMWQPSRFRKVPAERLAEWERVLRVRVGLPIEGLASDQVGNASLSATLPNDCMDDSDMQEM
jgi:hypothetical protein